jgi:ABC-2 type transport system ATP-binding protein
MNEIIKTNLLTKAYHEVLAVNSISLQVNQGEIYGFLGLNGAGKTTTIRMLLGMIKSTNGSVSILGKNVADAHGVFWNKIGYLVEMPNSYPNLTVQENLELIRKLRGLKQKECVYQIMELLSLTEYKNRKAKDLSLGNGQRLGLAKALIHKPEILILDEPTNGLDPSGIHEIREYLIHLSKNEGVTIFISSHILSEISKMAHRIGIIHNGILKQELESAKLAELSLKKLSVSVLDVELAKKIMENNQVEFKCSDQNDFLIFNQYYIDFPNQIANMLVKSGCELTQLTIIEEDLESYFLRTINS